MALSKRKKNAHRALTPLTRESTRETGEIVREFDVRSATMVLGAAVGVVFLLFFLAAFLPWLLANGMTAAVEGMMHQVGFDDFRADTLGDWILVLFIGAVFTAFIVAIAVSILALYNVLSQRTGMGLRVMAELPAAEDTTVIEAAPEKAGSTKAGTTKTGTTKTGTTKTGTTKTGTTETGTTKTGTTKTGTRILAKKATAAKKSSTATKSTSSDASSAPAGSDDDTET